MNLRALGFSSLILISTELNAAGPILEASTIVGVKTVMRLVRNLLVIDVSPNLGHSHSRALSKHFVEGLQRKYPREYTPIYRDLEEVQVPHLSARNIEVITKGTETTPEAKILKGLSDTFIGELKRAHAVVISTPVHNFTIPTSLKAYFDLVLRAGTTFRYTSNGAQGMLSDRPVMLITSAGGCYYGTKSDFLTPYVRHVFDFIGIKNVTAVAAEGIAIEGKKNKALIKAKEELEQQLMTFHQATTILNKSIQMHS